MTATSKKILQAATAALMLLIAPSHGNAQADEERPPAIERVWTALEGEPFQTFQRARERFLAEDFEDAARFMRKGAAFLWLETERADTATLKGLEAAAAALGKVAKRTEAGELYNAGPVEAAFARAHYTLAGHYSALAGKYERSGELEKAVRAADISAGHLLVVNYWLPEGLAAEDIAGLKKTRWSLDKTDKGEESTKSTLGEAFKKLNRGMEKLSKYIRFYEGEQE